MKVIMICASLVLLSGCSVVGKESVENAPYTIVQTAAENEAIELRTYDRMILISAPMNGGIEGERNNAFRALFKYISGDNVDQSKIAMTAPVIMDDAAKDSGKEIPMTAPVFMDGDNESAMMSFVMPADFTLETTPVPTNPDVKVQELLDYMVAAITFNGRLEQGNIDKHRELLLEWIVENDYKQIGPYRAAGYNPPFTIPAFRRNEVLIPVEAP